MLALLRARGKSGLSGAGIIQGEFWGRTWGAQSTGTEAVESRIVRDNVLAGRMIRASPSDRGHRFPLGNPELGEFQT